MFNLGHGMLPFVQPERLQVVIDTVRSFRRHENPAHESNHG